MKIFILILLVIVLGGTIFIITGIEQPFQVKDKTINENFNCLFNETQSKTFYTISYVPQSNEGVDGNVWLINLSTASYIYSKIQNNWYRVVLSSTT